MKNRYTIDEFRRDYPNDDACLDKIFKLRFTNLVCPKCEGTDEYKRVKNRRAYQCPNCSHQLYPTKDTVFEKTTTPLTYWFYAIYLQTTTRNGVAAKELERQLNVCYKTALRMAHQIKKLMADRNKEDRSFQIICELDETLIGGSIANKHNGYRKEYKERKQNHYINKSIVFGIAERNGKIMAKVVAEATKETIMPIIEKNVEPYTKVMTDTASIYRTLKNKEYFHYTVNHELSEYKRGEAHTNTIEGFWSQLKRTIKGTHIKVSAEHLQKYVDEVAFRYMNRQQQDQMFNLVLERVVF